MQDLTTLSDKELINRYGTLTPLEKELLRRYNNIKAELNLNLYCEGAERRLQRINAISSL